MIYFRQVDEPKLGRGIFWQVEYYAEEGSRFPVGVAYIEAPPASLPKLNFILVADQWRGKGIGTELLIVCIEKWPDLEFSSPISPEGERVVQRGEKLRRDFPEGRSDS